MNGHRPIAAMLTAALILTTAALSQDGPRNRTVQERQIAMRSANAAITRLADMANGRAPFDPRAARAARKALIHLTGDLPGLFRRPRTDVVSHARAAIWEQPDTFEARIREARRAARWLRVRNAARLGQSLAPMVSACLACHRDFRDPRP